MTTAQQTGTVGWLDLTTDKADELRDFYAAVMGWQVDALDMGGYSDYNMLAPKGGEPAAGICHARGANDNLPAQWLLYVNVEDIDSSIRRAVELGGHLVDGPRKMGKNRFCVIRDPAGAVIALISA